jgi:hypothetical protein
MCKLTTIYFNKLKLKFGNILDSIENKLKKIKCHLIIPDMKFKQTSLSWLDQ